ncbi:MAG TPA: alpha/beta fold hydrolase [Usitatibacter sp.]|nr:alpha/beta fold hydrolase [Usitatibacter sp.]
MTDPHRVIHHPRQEHSVPWFWPLAAAIEMGEQGMSLFRDNLRYVAEAGKIDAPPLPGWATPNRILLDLETMRLRDFTPAGHAHAHKPVLIDAPYAGHSSTIADFAVGQSLVATLQAAGLERVLVTDWKSATDAMKDFGIDKYLADIDTAVDHVGGTVDLVGLCQGGWMSAMYAARFPGKVRTLVLAGAPIDTDAGDGAIKKLAHSLPLAVFGEMVAAGGGLMRGRTMLAGWKSMNPGEQYLGKYLELYHHIEEKNYIKRTETFERWYENPIDLPGAYYLQTIEQIFKENRLAKGQFVGLGKRLSLKDIVCPVYLLAGAEDEITTQEQVFGAEKHLGTPKSEIVKKVAPGGHIGLFMGSKTLAESWIDIAHWIREYQRAR